MHSGNSSGSKGQENCKRNIRIHHPFGGRHGAEPAQRRAVPQRELPVSAKHRKPSAHVRADFDDQQRVYADLHHGQHGSFGGQHAQLNDRCERNFVAVLSNII